MSLNVLKLKTNALYLKNKKQNNLNLFVRPQFMGCCNNNYFSMSNHGFFLNGGFRPNSYIGKQYLMSSNNLNHISNSNYIKPSVINHSSYIKRKLLQNKNFVKPINCGTNKSDNHSQGVYIDRIKSCNSDIFDINKSYLYQNDSQTQSSCNICSKKYFNMVKNTKQPLTMENYITYRKKHCIKNLPPYQAIGKSCYV